MVRSRQEDMFEQPTNHLNSHQTTHASPRFRPQDYDAMRQNRLPRRGSPGLLCLLPYHALHDRALYRHPIRRI